MRTTGLRVGDRVEYLGGRTFREDPPHHLDRGCVGVVEEIKPPRRGLGTIVDRDGEELPDPDRDGYAVVRFPTWDRRIVVWPEGENTRWRRLPG